MESMHMRIFHYCDNPEDGELLNRPVSFQDFFSENYLAYLAGIDGSVKIETVNNQPAVTIYPDKGLVKEAGEYIKRRINPLLYMNGFCWSSLIKYYARANHLRTGVIDTDIDENFCVFILSEVEEAERLKEFIEDTIWKCDDLCDWIIATDFDEWDDW